jgi:hypothetical protein
MLLALLFVEYLPKPIPTSNFAIPEYVQVIKNLPGTPGVLDTVPSMYLTLLYQTLHQKPLAFGLRLARTSECRGPGRCACRCNRTRRLRPALVSVSTAVHRHRRYVASFEKFARPRDGGLERWTRLDIRPISLRPDARYSTGLSVG